MFSATISLGNFVARALSKKTQSELSEALIEVCKAEKDDVDAVKKLVKEGLRVDKIEYCFRQYYHHPLWLAAEKGHTEIVSFLRELSCVEGFILEQAIEDRRAKIIETFLDAGSLVNTELYGRFLLEHASLKGRNEILKLLIQRGANVDLPADSGCRPPLVRAVAKGYTDSVSILLAAGAKTDLLDEAGNSLLLNAVKELAHKNRDNDLTEDMLACLVLHSAVDFEKLPLEAKRRPKVESANKRVEEILWSIHYQCTQEDMPEPVQMLFFCNDLRNLLFEFSGKGFRSDPDFKESLSYSALGSASGSTLTDIESPADELVAGEDKARALSEEKNDEPFSESGEADDVDLYQKRRLAIEAQQRDFLFAILSLVAAGAFGTGFVASLPADFLLEDFSSEGLAALALVLCCVFLVQATEQAYNAYKTGPGFFSQSTSKSVSDEGDVLVYESGQGTTPVVVT